MENIDVNYGPHIINRHQVLSKYTSALKQLRSKAERGCDLRPFAFDNFVFFQYFQNGKFNLTELSLPISSETSQFINFSPANFIRLELRNYILDRRRQILYWLFYLALAALCISAYRHEISSSMSEKIVRSMLYPGMRMWRRITLPLIERFPQLTELYDESCLMGNPFFQIDDVSCSPCSHVNSVTNLTTSFEIANSINKSTDESNGVESIVKVIPKEYAPFVFKISHDSIQLKDIYNMYLSNQHIFEREAYRVHSTNRDVTNIEELFNQFNQTMLKEQHNLWRFNRMLPARLLRKIIARPLNLPSGLALERYMTIDTSQAQSYTMPDTECPNVYIQQSLGTRFIILRPTSECRHRCRTLSLRLPQPFVCKFIYNTVRSMAIQLF